MKNNLILSLNITKKLKAIIVSPLYLTEVVQCLVEIGMHPSRRLIGDLDGVLQDSLRDKMAFGGGGGFSADKHPEVLVSSLCVLLQPFLQRT